MSGHKKSKVYSGFTTKDNVRKITAKDNDQTIGIPVISQNMFFQKKKNC